MSTLFFGGSSRSGLNLGPRTSGTATAFERDLAMIEARRRRLRNMKLGQRSKERENTWFFDRFIPDKLEQGVDEVATSLIYTIPGIYQMAATVGRDLSDLAMGDVTPERSAAMFGQMGKQMYTDVRHPLRHPGYTAMTLFGLASMGLGTGARVGAAAGAYARMNPMSAAARSLARMEGMPRSSSSALFHAIPPSMRPRIKFDAPRERGNQDPTVPEVHTEQGIEPQPDRGLLKAFGRRQARKQLKSLEQLMASPGYRPNLVDDAARRDLSARAGVPLPPSPADEALSALPSMNPADRRAYLEQQRATPVVGRQSAQVPEVDEPGMAYLQQRQAARDTRAAERAARDAAEAERRAGILQNVTQMQERNRLAEWQASAQPHPLTNLPRLNYESMAAAARSISDLSESYAYRMLPRASIQVPPGGLPEPGAFGPSVGRPMPQIPAPAPVVPRQKAPAKTARTPRAAASEPIAAAAAALPGEPVPAGAIDYEQLADLIAARMAGDGGMAPLGSLEPEPPRAPGRPRQEGGHSEPQKRQMRDYENAWEHFKEEGEGSWRAEYAGQPAGHFERQLDKDGAEVFVPDPDSPSGQRRVYAVTLQNPSRTRTGRPFTHKVFLTAIDDAEAASLVRKFWAEWMTTGRLSRDPRSDPKGKTRLPPLTKGKFTGKKQGDVAAGAADIAWAQRQAELDPAAQGVEPAEKIAPVGKSEKQILEDSQAEMDRVKADLQAEMEAIGGPSDSELAAIEDEALGVDPAPVAKPAKAKAKAKALKGEELDALDVDALNRDLNPALSRLGLHYDEKGFLKMEAGVEIDDVLTELGFDAGDAFMIEDALEGAAGEVSAGGKFSMKEFTKRLEDNFEGTDISVADVLNKLFGAQGGTQQAMAREMLRAFMAPRQRQSTTIKVRMPEEMGSGAERHRVFREVESDQIMLSNNPVVRMAWYTAYGALKALENPYAKEGAGNWASRQLRRKVRFEQAEIQRINELAEKANVSKEARKYEAMLEEAKRTEWGGGTFRVWDSINRGAMMGILFLKPAYLSANLIGQVGLAMIDHAWNPVNVYDSVQLQRKLFKDPKIAGVRAAKIKAAMGEGAIESLSAGPGASKRIFQTHDFTSRQYAKLLDTPFRDNSFINEARRQGFDSAEKIARLVDAPEGSPLNQQFVDIARRANRNMIDFGRLNNIEKQLVRRILIFYPWLKGATIYGARFASEHPFQFTAAIQVGRMGAEKTEEQLGMLPSFMQQQGVFKVGEREVPGLGRVPEIMNPAAISILGTPGETLNIARAAIAGDVRQSEELGESLTPAATAALSAFTGTDPFTGAKIDPSKSYIERALGSLGDTLPFVRQAKQLDRAQQIESGEVDPREVLQPMNKQDVLGRWLGPGFGAAVDRPLGEFALNPREARQRAAAEQRTFGSKSESQMALHRDYRDRAREEAKKLGLNLPKEFDQAMALRGQREAEIAVWEEENGKSNAFDRLEADMRLLVRRKQYTEKEAKEILNNFAALDEASINRFRRQLGDAFFGGDVRSYYKKLLTVAGASIDQGW